MGTNCENQGNFTKSRIRIKQKKEVLKSSKVMKIQTKVKTPDGPGIIVAIEQFRTCTRYGVKLENNPFTFPIAYYFENEVFLAFPPTVETKC